MNLIHSHAQRQLLQKSPVPQKAGVVLIDMQHTHEELRKEGAKTLQGYQNAANLVGAARDLGLPIAFVRYLRGKKALNPVNPIVAEAAGSSATVIEKDAWSAFARPPLSEFLDEKQVAHVIIGGWHTHCCVYHTLKGGLSEGKYSFSTSGEILVPFGHWKDENTALAVGKYYRKETNFFETVSELIENMRRLVNRA